MMRKQHNRSNTPDRPWLIVLSVVQVLAVVWMIVLQLSLNTSIYSSERNVTQLLNSISELRFCVDNQIHPCDDISIQQWNLNHTDNQFHIQHSN